MNMMLSRPKPLCLPATFLFMAILSGMPATVPAETIDFADPAQRSLWLSHPVIGDVSYDAFVRSPGNPIYTGAPPHEWPVNGFLFRDPRSTNWYCYVGLYPKGYLPFGPCRLLRSSDRGANWTDLGLVLQGDKDFFDGDGKTGGGTPDVSVVADDDGYHMVYDWGNPDNSDGGLGYAFARSPEGPWQRHHEPIHAESKQPLIPPGYKRVYAGSLVKRARDWLVIAAMSTPGNGGGMWTLICMTAPRPQGPWTEPIFLRSPHRGEWEPQPLEFFPSFVHEGHVYAAMTSVAANRGYQLLLRAPIEDAHQPESWQVHQAGSLFHAKPITSEAMGIWGQAFSGMVEPGGRLHVMYPSRRADGVGTTNLASRPWEEPFRPQPWLSGPNAPAVGLLLRAYDEFELSAVLQANGAWRLLWNHDAPLGPDRSTAGAVPHPLMMTRTTSFSLNGAAWRVEEISAEGKTALLAGGSLDGERSTPVISVRQRAGEATVTLDGTELCTVAVAGASGAIGLLAEKGTCLQLRQFTIDGTPQERSFRFLALEGLLGAAQKASDWKKEAHGFRFGEGYSADFDGAQAKWSFEGTRAVLWAPRDPAYGAADLFLDGRPAGHVNYHAGERQTSAPLWDSGVLPRGRHAVRIVRTTGVVPVDCLEFRP